MFQTARGDSAYVPRLVRSSSLTNLCADRQVQEKNEFGDVKTAVK